MTPSFDAIIIGLGAMGSAAACELAGRGARVLGMDRLAPPHALGSTHGESRIIREAYFADPRSVPLVRRAYERWAALEREAGRALSVRTGGLMIGPEEGHVVAGAAASARLHGLPHEMLSAAAVRARFPAYDPPNEHVALLEPRAGLLFPEACVEACLALARRRGAELRLEERAVAWEGGDDGVTVRTERGRYRAARLVLAAGPWMPELLSSLLPLAVERQMFHWFAPAEPNERAALAPERCPIALWEYRPGGMVATFPDLGSGVKFCIHHEGELTSPEAVRRTVSAEEDARARSLLARLMPGAAGPVAGHRVCLYTNTPDGHFVLDWHPAHPGRVLLVSPCSGHGFKFASALGEVAARMALGEDAGFDLGLFRADRFADRVAPVESARPTTTPA